MNSTDHSVLGVLQDIAVDDIAVISTRRLAERVGRHRSAAANSLLRLVERGKIERVRSGGSVRMSRYRVLENRCKTETKMTPVEPLHSDLPDIFRSPSLYGAGCLHTAAPKMVPLTVSEILALGVTRSRGGVNGQLLKLESLPVPLAISEADPSHVQRMLWTFQVLTPDAEARILEYLDRLAPQFRPRYRLDQEAQHLIEQEGYRWLLGLEPYSVIADRDVMPNVIQDPETGCLLFEGALNNSGYGIVHADRLGVGTHRVVWFAERGPVPAGKELHHTCQQRNCVNVDHLQVLSKAEHIAATWPNTRPAPAQETPQPVAGKTC